MARRTASEIYAAARAAGLSVSQAITATAIALAESSGNDQAIGDTALQNATWGPSVGLWQIRTLNAQTGTGGVRDVNWLNGNVQHQAAAMYQISRSGVDWSPWTVYNTGAYRQYLGQAQTAASGDAGGSVLTGATPVGLPGSGAVQEVAESAVRAAQNILLKVGAAGFGLALLGVGLFYALKGDQAVKKTQAKQTQLRKAVVGV